FIANGVAEFADADNIAKEDFNDVTGVQSKMSAKIFGHRWNYDDSEINYYAKAYARTHGLDENSAELKDVIKYLQDNEHIKINSCRGGNSGEHRPDLPR
ncbi:MAG: hypothetical protein V4671_15105, partial [Armatimonadota bacterium]